MDASTVPQVVPEGRSIYCFKVTLERVRPAIWRRLEVPGDFTFDQFGKVIITAMGWKGYHLYQFLGPSFDIVGPGVKDGEDFFIGFPGFEKKTEIEGRGVKISEIFSMEKKSLKFEYDFGDGWTHKILLESISPPVEGSLYPACTAGKNACPPEDCGGADGYKNLLEILRNPRHKEHQEMTEWLEHCGYEKNFDPTSFVPSEVTFG
jgi:hypothetical protein